MQTLEALGVLRPLCVAQVCPTCGLGMRTEGTSYRCRKCLWIYHARCMGHYAAVASRQLVAGHQSCSSCCMAQAAVVVAAARAVAAVVVAPRKHCLDVKPHTLWVLCSHGVPPLLHQGLAPHHTQKMVAGNSNN